MAQTALYDGKVIVLGFHLRDGLHFQRGDEGEITIVKTNGQAFDPEIEWELTVSAEEWASVVASVSRRGETGETWAAARDFHQIEEGAQLIA